MIEERSKYFSNCSLWPMSYLDDYGSKDTKSTLANVVVGEHDFIRAMQVICTHIINTELYVPIRQIGCILNINVLKSKFNKQFNTYLTMALK